MGVLKIYKINNLTRIKKEKKRNIHSNIISQPDSPEQIHHQILKHHPKIFKKSKQNTLLYYVFCFTFAI